MLELGCENATVGKNGLRTSLRNPPDHHSTLSYWGVGTFYICAFELDKRLHFALYMYASIVLYLNASKKYRCRCTPLNFLDASISLFICTQKFLCRRTPIQKFRLISCLQIILTPTPIWNDWISRECGKVPSKQTPPRKTFPKKWQNSPPHGKVPPRKISHHKIV